MSIGNLQTDGNKGSNFPYQIKVLQGLQCVCDELKKLNIDTAAIEQTLLDIEALIGDLATEATLQQVEINTSGTVRTPEFIRVSGSSGTIPAGKFSMSFASVGTSEAYVKGMSLKPGEIINFDAGALNNTLDSVDYDTTFGGELIIIFIS
jgi:hypothetical protein